jgi:phosphoribosyl-ATP pyrophosphohydrolase
VQHGEGACHTGERSCFYRTLTSKDGTNVSDTPMTGVPTAPGTDAPSTPAIAADSSLGAVLEELAAVLEQRHREQPEGSYTVKLLTGPQDKLLKKIAEEAGEVIIAARDHDVAQTRYEIADLIYHLLVVMEREGVSPADLAVELASRRR